MHQGMAPASYGLKIAQEAMEEGMGDEEHQPESGDGNGMMMEVVVGMPIVGQLVEAFVFDAPALMAEEDDMPGGRLVFGERGDPDPFAGNGSGSAGWDVCFKTAHDANAMGIRVPRGEVGFVPAPVGGASLPVTKSRCRGEDGPRVLQQVSPLVFEHHERVFAMLAQEFEETGLRIEAVAQKDIEAARLCGDNPPHQTERGGALVVMGAEEFEIHQKPEAGADELEDHRPVIILDALLPIDGEFALLAVRAAALVTTVDFVAVHHRQTMAVKVPQHFVAAQLSLESLEQSPQIMEVRGLRDVGDLIDAGHAAPEKPAQGRLATVALQRLQTGQTAQEQQEHGLIKSRSRDLRLLPVVA